MDLYDYKPEMNEWYDKDLPDSIRKGQRLTTMTSGQKRFPIAPSKFKFAQHGNSGMWVSELLPYTAKMVDDMCFIRTMHTEAINHEPAITYMQTGNQITGRPCLGAWTSYGLGSLNRRFADVRGAGGQADQHRTGAGHFGSALVERLSCRASMPAFASAPAAIRSLYINNPPGVPVGTSAAARSTGFEAVERNELSSRWAIRKRKLAFSNTNWPSACRPACPN